MCSPPGTTGSIMRDVEGGPGPSMVELATGLTKGLYRAPPDLGPPPVAPILSREFIMGWVRSYEVVVEQVEGRTRYRGPCPGPCPALFKLGWRRS